MTAALNGVGFILQSSPDNGTTYHTIAGSKQAQFKRKTAAIDTTTKDDNSDESFIAGKRGWTIDFSDLWVSGDAGQLDVQAAQAAGTSLKMKLQFNSGVDTYVGTAIVTALDEDMADGAAVTFTGTLQGSGALVKAGLAH
jgi:predicted secreted protein